MNLSDPDSTGRSHLPPGDRPIGNTGSRKNQSRSRKSRSQRVAGSNQSAAVDPHDDATLVPHSRSCADRSGKSETDAAGTQPVSDRYLSLGEVGRGGWGVVEKVIDRQLDREVAVKRLTDCTEVTEQDRQRFLHEAKVTSQLQHPGIVPVHELGDRRDAFYVMKLLDGMTFQECIENHHREASSGSRPTRFQYGQSIEPLLQRFVDICNAVAYAHQRGVIHRDLKPSNVMISGFGETIVLDWGLATSADRNGQSDHQPNHSGNRSPSAHVSSLLEPNGTIVGTPAYMSPEQSAGDIDNIKRASDIYSLGIILHTVIAGRHPYQGLELKQVLDQVSAGAYPSLKTTQPLTPTPLGAIFKKATARNPDDRYKNAEELASDVRRFIAGESVSVHRENVIERSVRWCRHHQGIAATISASVLCLLVASVIFGVVIKQAHRAEKAARIAAQRAHQEAIASLGEAREATDTWLVELSGSLQFYPGMSSLRGELIERAMDQYGQIAQQNRATESQWNSKVTNRDEIDFEACNERIETLAMLEQAKASLRLGDLCRLAGKTDEARRHYDSAERDLIAHEPTSANQRVRRVSSSSEDVDSLNFEGTLRQRLTLEHINVLIGKRLIEQSDLSDPVVRTKTKQARQWLWRLVQAMVSQDKTDENHQLDSFSRRVASAYVRLELSAHAGSRADVVHKDTDNFQKAILIASWLAENGDTVGDRRLSETIQTFQCQQLTEAGMHEPALAKWSVLIDDLQNWSTKNPGRIDYRQSLAHALLQRGNCRVALGLLEEARVDFEEAIGTLRQAWRMTDDDGFYRTNLATAENNLGHLLTHFDEKTQRDGGSAAIANDLLTKSLQIYESLLREEVTAERLHRYAQTHYALSNLGHGSETDSGATQADHARKAAYGFEILKDYQTLTADDLLKWIDCEIRSADAASEGDGSQAMMQSIRSIRDLIDQSTLNDRQQKEFVSIDQSIEALSSR